MFFTVVTLLSAFVQPARADTVRATITATIAEDSPRTPFLFGAVTGLAIDAMGRVYVSDAGETLIAVFATDGKPLAKIGRKGKGPGEFEYPTGPVIGSDGALYVRNMSAFSRFVVDPKTGIPSAFDKSFQGPLYAPWRSKAATVIDRNNRLHFPLEWGTRDGLSHTAFLRYTLEGRKLDSIGVPTQTTTRGISASIPEGKNGGTMVKGLNAVPFHPMPVFTVSAWGNIIASPSNEYWLTETDVNGRVVRTIRRSVVAPTIPPAERADSAKALQRRIDSLKVPLAQVEGVPEEVKARRLPTSYPLFRSLSMSPNGMTWARRWSAAGQGNESWFDIIDAVGQYTRTVVVPVDCATMPAPVVRGGVLSCVTLDPETGAESVVIARVPVTR